MFKRKYIFLGIIIVLAVLYLANSYANSHCCRQVSPVYYETLSLSSGCPCVSDDFTLPKQLGNSSVEKACVSRFDFSQLTGRLVTLTSQDYGEAFSCFYQNFATNEKEQVVEYGTSDEIKNYHKACDRVIRELAGYYKLNCVQ